MPEVVLNFDEMDSMIFWRLCPGKKIVNSITC